MCGTKAGILTDRVSEAITNALQEAQQNGMNNASNIKRSVETRMAQVEGGVIAVKNYEQLLVNPDNAITRRYADRAIVREVDQILSIIRSSHSGDSTFELELTGEQTRSFDFNRAKANSFHRVVTSKKIGDPVIYNAMISVMDRHNLSAKIINVVNNSICTLHFIDEDMFQLAMPFFDKKDQINFIGSPYIEYGAFDPLSGDIYFIRLL